MQKFNNTEGFWDGLGTALVVLAVFIGFGGCIYLANHDKECPIIQINTEKIDKPSN